MAFAIGTALAFSIVYAFVAKGVRAHIDAWLTGEAEVLARVSADTPRDSVYDRIVEEVAELASKELPRELNSRGQPLNSVFFLLQVESNSNPLWVGPGSRERFLERIRSTDLVPRVPQSIKVAGERIPYRVVLCNEVPESKLYLGLSDRGSRHILHQLTVRFVAVWACIAVFGFLVLEDNGPGFPPDISARAFERFVKGKHSPGHGLGLAFVDAVVQSHGGRVKISDRPQGGAVISVALPLSVLQPA